VVLCLAADGSALSDWSQSAHATLEWMVAFLALSSKLSLTHPLDVGVDIIASLQIRYISPPSSSLTVYLIE